MSASFNVLVVDDDRQMTRTLVDILLVKGFGAIGAHSGQEAMQIISQQSIQLVLSDVKMPDMSGVELVRAIKKSWSHIPLVLMTAYSASEVIQEGMKEGVKTVLTKPLDINFLLTLLETFKHVLDSE